MIASLLCHDDSGDRANWFSLRTPCLLLCPGAIANEPPSPEAWPSGGCPPPRRRVSPCRSGCGETRTKLFVSNAPPPVRRSTVTDAASESFRLLQILQRGQEQLCSLRRVPLMHRLHHNLELLDGPWALACLSTLVASSWLPPHRIPSLEGTARPLDSDLSPMGCEHVCKGLLLFLLEDALPTIP